jgi:hypothetical protein
MTMTGAWHRTRRGLRRQEMGGLSRGVWLVLLNADRAATSGGGGNTWPMASCMPEVTAGVWHCEQGWQLSQDAVKWSPGIPDTARLVSPGGVARSAAAGLSALACWAATVGAGPATPAQAQLRSGSRANSARQNNRRNVTVLKVAPL